MAFTMGSLDVSGCDGGLQKGGGAVTWDTSYSGYAKNLAKIMKVYFQY